MHEYTPAFSPSLDPNERCVLKTNKQNFNGESLGEHNIFPATYQKVMDVAGDHHA